MKVLCKPKVLNLFYMLGAMMWGYLLVHTNNQVITGCLQPWIYLITLLFYTVTVLVGRKLNI